MYNLQARRRWGTEGAGAKSEILRQMNVRFLIRILNFTLLKLFLNS